MAKQTKQNKKNVKFEEFRKRALELGATFAKVIPAETITTATWVRFRCQYGCPMFNKKYTCPPNSPTPETTENMLKEFKTAILFESDALNTTKLASELERDIFVDGFYKAIGMGSGPCMICNECAPVEEGCRFPFKARPSMEACGIDVYQTVKNHKIKLEVVKEFDHPQRHFGIVLIE